MRQIIDAVEGFGARLVESDDLPMDKKSRLQRAVDMGFDVSTVYYHGTPYTDGALDVLQSGSWERVAGQPYYFPDGSKNPNAMVWVPSERQQVWFTPIPKYAHHYARRGNTKSGAIYPVFLRKDAIRIGSVPNEVYVTDLTAIRSIHAAFDPDKDDQADLMA